MTFKNNKTKTYLIVGLSLVAMLASSSSLSNVIAQTSVNTPVSNSPLDADEMMANIENDVPGFGGAFMDKNGVLNIYEVSSKASTTQTDTERSAHLEKHLGKEHMTKGMVTLEGKYTFSELLAYKNKLTTLFSKQLDVTVVGIDKPKNLVMIGVETMGKVDLVKKEMSKLDIPKESVEIVETGKIVPNNHTQKYRPIPGGVQLQYAKNILFTGTCSVGIAADHATKGRVLVTAGHCSADGNRDHTDYYQSTWPFDGIGSGILGTNTANNRWSDSVLISPTVSTSRGIVHRDAGGDLTLPGKQYTYVVGDPLNKSGRTTMDTSGVTSATCMDITEPPSPQVFFCQDFATYSSADGDSGGTVYEFDTLSGTYKWYGIHIAVVSSGPFAGAAVLSTVQDIERDQGTLTIH